MNRVVFDSVDSAPTKLNDDDEELKDDLDEAGVKLATETDAAGVSADQHPSNTQAASHNSTTSCDWDND